MTDLEKEMLRQIHELDKEVKILRERVAVLEAAQQPPTLVYPIVYPSPTRGPFDPPFIVTCGGSST